MMTRAPLAFVCAILLIGALPASAQRLPDTVQPVHYRLRFAPDLAAATFTGHATIDVNVKAATRAITLNAAELVFGTTTITAAGRSQIARPTLDAAHETATLQVPEPLPAGPAVIDIEYTGTLNGALRGFYLSKTANRRYAVTQMEPTDARRAFPAFDEPALKATFDISAVIDRNDVAISNGRQLTDVPGPSPGTHTVTFATTPRLSTYLIALLVGDFQCRSGSSDGTPIRICSTPEKLPLTAFALEAAKQQVAFYNRYFGIKYPFGKLDIIGIPDFAAGAMENAGAITFRERNLFVDPAGGSVEMKKRVADVLAHEIAHQWFGNLVTMQWWDDIWLNEGFASWMEHKPLAAWQKDWNVKIDEALATQSALELDILRSTRAIRTKAETPDEINELFDGIAYNKTAAVLRMVESYVGEEPFRAGIQSYLKKHAFANATGEDFWSEVARVTGKPVDTIMRSFVDQPGAPLLATSGACRDRRAGPPGPVGAGPAGASQLTLTQERFSSAAATPPSSSERWTIPVCTRTPGGKARCEVIDQPSQPVTLDTCASLLNAGERGYYFSEYSPDTLHALRANMGRLEAVERLGLLGDEWWMARTGRHDVGEYLDLAGTLAATETGPGIAMMADRLSTIANIVVPASEATRFEAWIRARFRPALDKLGLTSRARDSETQRADRAALTSLVGIVGNDPAVQARVRELVDTYLTKPSTLPASFVTPALQIAAMHGGADLYDRYQATLPALANQPEEYYRRLFALSWFREPLLVARTLDLTISQSLRGQDTGALLSAIFDRPWARDAAWTFVRAHWNELSPRLTTFSGVGVLVDALGNFCSTASANEVRQFFTEHPPASAARTLEQTIERIQSCSQFRERQAPALSRWLP
jgi:aminopeptidase N